MHIKLQKPHLNQLKVLREAKRFNVLCCGRRWGKSKLAVHLVVKAALSGKEVAYYAPTYGKTLKNVWRELKLICQPVAKYINEVDKRIELLTGGSIECWSLDNPDSSRGCKYHLIVIDEAGIIAGLDQIWYDTLRPTLTDYKGSAWFVSTPKGRNFFWEAWNKGQDEIFDDWISWSMPTTSNPYISGDEVAQAKKDMPSRSFRQEYLAEFIMESGGVFEGIDAVIGVNEQIEPEKDRSYHCGVDLGQIQDYTVVSIIDDLGRQCYLSRTNQRSWDFIQKEIIHSCNKYGAFCMVEKNFNPGVIEAISDAGIKVEEFNTSATSKQKIIEQLAAAIEHKEILLLKNTVQENELKAFEYILSKSGKVQMGAPSPLHDDTVIALAIAWNALKQRPRVFFY